MWGGLEEERKPGASTPPESNNPDKKKFKKKMNPRLCNGSIYTGDGQQFIPMRSVEVKLPIKTHL